MVVVAMECVWWWMGRCGVFWGVVAEKAPRRDAAHTHIYTPHKPTHTHTVLDVIAGATLPKAVELLGVLQHAVGEVRVGFPEGEGPRGERRGGVHDCGVF